MCGSGSHDGYRDGEVGFDGDDKRMELYQTRLGERCRAQRRLVTEPFSLSEEEGIIRLYIGNYEWKGQKELLRQLYAWPIGVLYGP